MKQQKVNASLLDKDFILVDGVMYRLEKLNHEEIIEAVCNKGDALPLIASALNKIPV